MAVNERAYYKICSYLYSPPKSRLHSLQLETINFLLPICGLVLFNQVQSFRSKLNMTVVKKGVFVTKQFNPSFEPKFLIDSIVTRYMYIPLCLVLPFRKIVIFCHR